MEGARNLTLEFEGFFQCRLATDPDPPSETRGLSGYTFALGGESDLDQVIRLQLDEIEPRNFRQPFPPYLASENPEFGVFVRRVHDDGKPVKDHPLIGATVRWPGNPTYELRNQIVSDGYNRIVPVIVPFAYEIRGRDGAYLFRSDPLDPEHPDLQIWQLRPERYRRRVAKNYFSVGSELVDRLFDGNTSNSFYNAYFQARQEWLELEISKLAAHRAAGHQLQIDALRTRIFQIDQQSGSAENLGRMESRLPMQAVWEHSLVGQDAVIEGLSGLSTEAPWHTRFWMGGWDGDLLVGWLGGRLEVPKEASR